MMLVCNQEKGLQDRYQWNRTRGVCLSGWLLPHGQLGSGVAAHSGWSSLVDQASVSSHLSESLRVRNGVLVTKGFLADPGEARGCSTNTSVIN